MAVIAITGAAGYLGSWVVAEALRLGHTVHGTVRDPDDLVKLTHLLQLQASHPGRLRLFASDLLREGSFDAACDSAEYLIHTASPYVRGGLKNPQAELIAPAVDGTRNVLRTASRCPSIRRVVLTSSIAAMAGSLQQVYAQPQHRLQESHWNTLSTPSNDPYGYAKTQAERAAWEVHDTQDRWSLVTINPGAIFGPSLSRRTDAESVKMVIQFVQGAFAAGVPDLQLGVVDVRDVAAAHVQAALNPAAAGRYLLVNQTCSLLELARIIRDSTATPPQKLPRRALPKWLIWLLAPAIGMSRHYVAANVGFATVMNGIRCVEDLQVRYTTVAQTLCDHIAQLHSDGLIA